MDMSRGRKKKKYEIKEEVQTWNVKFESQNKTPVIIFSSKPPVEGNDYVKNRSLGLSVFHIFSEHQFPLLLKNSLSSSTANKDRVTGCSRSIQTNVDESKPHW